VYSRLTIKLDDTCSFPLNVFDFEDGPHFVKTFEEALHKLPLSAQQVIRDYWLVTPDLVWLEIESDWKGHITRNAEVNEAGRSIAFNGIEFSKMPEPVAMFVIAHELALVYQHGTAKAGKADCDLEDQANKLANEWGFDEPAYLNWEGARTPQEKDVPAP